MAGSRCVKNNLNDSNVKGKMRVKQNFTKLYLSAAFVMDNLKSKSAHLKSLVYGCKNVEKKQLLAIVVKTLENKVVIDKIIEKSNTLQSFEEQSLVQVALCEIVFGSGNLTTNHTQLKKIQDLKSEITDLFKTIDLKVTDSIKINQLLPRYVRINTLLCPVSQCLKDLKLEGFEEIDYDSQISFISFLELVNSLTLNQFIIDYHFDTVLVFNPHQQLYKLALLKKGFMFISDKASHIPPFLLSPPPGSSCIDTCAAPGLKTIHLAASMRNKGKLFAFDLNPERFEILKKHLNLGGVKCCQARCFDFLHIKPTLESYKDIEYALVDPSCSGSGMVARMDHLFDNEKKDLDRLKRISSFQISILKRALRFPNIKRVVYSTCSIYNEENEAVVEEVLKSFKGIFEVVEAFPKWPERGDLSYEFGSKCIRTIPSQHKTNGFFVAVIERVGWNGEYTKTIIQENKVNNEAKIKSNVKEITKAIFVKTKKIHSNQCSKKRKSTKREKLRKAKFALSKTNVTDI